MGSGGELGIYPLHAPLMTTLKAGAIRVQQPEQEELTLAVRADDIDEAAAQRARAEAERELLTRTDRMEIAEAQAKLAEAMAQLRAVEELRRRLKHRKR
jgi:F-type H+-transporting ATPase subunit epsilon